MKQKYIEAHMKAAEVYSELSSAIRLKVGCVVVKDNTIIGIGYNGMPAGWTNECEYKEYPDRYDKHSEWADLYFPLQEPDGTYYRWKTRPEVLHAERNALDKLAKGNEGGAGATMFITHAPCLECAKSIYGAGIRQVFYGEEYRSREGIEFLEKCHVEVEQVK
jgi:dCMP deaminase